MSEGKVLIIDNASGGVSYEEKWNYTHVDLADGCVNSIGMIPGGRTTKFETQEFSTLSALSKNLILYLESVIDDNTVIIFPNARSSLALTLNEYRRIHRLNFKMIGYWTTGIFDRDSGYRADLRGSDMAWIGKYERALIDCFDYNLLPMDSLYEKFKMYHRPPKRVKVELCPLPFTNAIQSMKQKAAEFNEVKEDLVIMNTAPDNKHDMQIFEAWKKAFPTYTFTNAYETNMSHISYIKLLARAKVVVSTNMTDHSPASIFEAMALGCIPIIPRIPVYEEMFDNDWLYDKIALKPPYLNYIRTRQQIEPKILNYVEKYDKYNLESEVERIQKKYFDSSKLKQIICSLI